MVTPVRVIVRRLSDGKVVTNKVVDHDCCDDRKWMGKTAFWAIRNSHSMETIPEEAA